MLATLALAAALAAAPAPEPPLEAVLAQAASAGKPLFLDVYATWCKPCRRLEAEVLSTPDVKRALGAYRAQRYDGERGHGVQVAHRYRVTEYPTLLILNPDGVELARLRAFTVEGMVRALDEWRPLAAVRGTFAAGKAEGRGEDPAYLLVSGVVLDRSGRAAEARALYDLAEALDPGDARGLASRAAFRKLKQDLSKTFVRNRGESLLAFAEKYPTGELAGRAIGAIARIAPAMRPATPRIRQASQAVLRGVSARKDHLSLDALAWSFLDLGFPDLALEAAKAAQVASPYELIHLLPEAAAHQAAGRQEEAVALIRKGLTVDPQNAGLAWALAQIQRQRLRRDPQAELFSDG